MQKLFGSMKEKYTDCEKGCVFFKTLLPNERRLNRRTREASRKGKEFPGSVGSMCGVCVGMEKINTDLEKQKKEFFDS